MRMTSPDKSPTDRPLAAEGLISYRYPSRYGWIMVGARDDTDALREASRSLSLGEKTELRKLQKWDGADYAPIQERQLTGASATLSGSVAIAAQSPPLELLKSFELEHVLASEKTIKDHMSESVIRASMADAGFVPDRIHDVALLAALLRGHRGQDITSLSETDWVSVMDEAEEIRAEWQREVAENGVPEDTPSIEWNGFNRPSEY